MLRKVSTALVIGFVAIGEAGVSYSATPYERAAAMPRQVVAKKRIPQSRLVKPKPTPPKTTTSVIRKSTPVRPQTISQSATRNQAEAPTPRVDLAPQPAPPRFDETPKSLPSETLPAEELPANDLPTESPLEEELPREPAREPEPEPTVEPLAEPAPKVTEPLDLDQPAPSSPAESEQATEDLPAPRGGIYRLEPPSKLIPVAADELKPGVIYLHEDSQGRKVWSFVQSNGQFWHAFGPGTTQALVHFDLRMTDEEALDELRKIDPKLAFGVTSQGTRVFLRLQADNTWKLVRTSSVPSIFDLETSQRWEKQWNRYLPVTHNCGDTWVHRDGQYWAPQWNESMRPN